MAIRIKCYEAHVAMLVYFANGYIHQAVVQTTTASKEKEKKSISFFAETRITEKQSNSMPKAVRFSRRF